MYQFPPLFIGTTPRDMLVAMDRSISNLGLYKDPDVEWLLGCAGQFTEAELLTGRGVKPSRIWSGDVTLFSSVLGFLFDPSKKVRDLEVELLDPKLIEAINVLEGLSWWSSLTEDTQDALIILVAIQYSKINANKGTYNGLMGQRYRELLPQIAHKIAQTLQKTHAKMGGMRYDVIDVIDQVDAFPDTEKHAVVLYPPFFNYGKYQAAADTFKWLKAYDLVFREAHALGDWLRGLLDRKGPVYIGGLNETIGPLMEKAYPHALAGVKPGENIMLWANRECDRPPAIALKKSDPTPSTMKVPEIYDDQEITEDSVIELRVIPGRMIAKLYSLMNKKTFQSETGMAFGMFVDGRLVFMNGYSSMRTYYAHGIIRDLFGVSATSRRYKQFGKLPLLIQQSREYIDFVTWHLRNFALTTQESTDFGEIQSTFVTDFPALSRMRGVMTLKKRELQKPKNGVPPEKKFMLVYGADIRPLTLQETLKAWWPKRGEVTS